MQIYKGVVTSIEDGQATITTSLMDTDPPVVATTILPAFYRLDEDTVLSFAIGDDLGLCRYTDDGDTVVCMATKYLNQTFFVAFKLVDNTLEVTEIKLVDEIAFYESI